jgi:hypothetical protein
VAIAAFKGRAEMWSNNGFAFSRERLDVELPCRSYEIVAVERYRPKELKRRFKGVGLDIIKRDTQLSVDGVRKALGARAGSDVTLAITSVEGENWVVEIKQI